MVASYLMIMHIIIDKQTSSIMVTNLQSNAASECNFVGRWDREGEDWPSYAEAKNMKSKFYKSLKSPFFRCGWAGCVSE